MVGSQVATKADIRAALRKFKQSAGGVRYIVQASDEDSVRYFKDLNDVPDTYAGAGNFLVRIKSTVDQVEFAALTGTANQISVAHGAAAITLAVVPQLILSDPAAAPYVKLVNASDTERDPIVQWAVGASPVVKFTAGVDDSDGDAWKLSAGSALGTNDRIVVTADPRIGFFTASPQAPIHYLSPAAGTAPDIIFEETGVGKSLQLRLKNVTRSWDIGSDASPDGFGFRDVDTDIIPLFFQGATGNVGLWWQTGAQWDAGDGSFGTGAPTKIISIKEDSVFPTVAAASKVTIGAFALGLGIQQGSVKSYFGDRWFLNDSANLDMTKGITVNCGTAVDQILCFKQTGFNNGFPDLVEIDTFADFRIDAVTGGVELNGYTTATGAIVLYPFYTTGNTVFTSAAVGGVTIGAAKAFVGDWGNCGATDNIFVLRPYYGGAWTSCWACNATGNSWQSGSIIAQGGLTVGLNGAGGAAGVITLRDGANPGTTATFTYAKWASLQAVTGVVKGNGAGVFSAAALGDLSNVNAAAPGDGEVLTWDAATTKWIAAPGGGALALDDLTDVVVPAPDDGDVLTWYGGSINAWVSAPPAGGAVNFTDLLDVPAAYAGAGGKVVKVKADASGLEFVAGGAGVASFTDLDDVPASYVGQAGKYPRVNVTETGLEYAAGGSGAPTTSKYLLQQADASLPNAQAMGALATGIVKNTTTTGVQSIATKYQDYSCPRWFHETFDGLNTATIVGQGSYNEAGAWADDTIGAGGSANVAVLSGADKMLTIQALSNTTSSISSTITTGMGCTRGAGIHFKCLIDQNTTGYSGFFRIYDTAATVVCGVYFRYSTTWQLAFWNGSGGTKLVDVAKDTWYTVDLWYDGTSASKATVFIDGTYRGAIATVATAAKWNKVMFGCISPAAGATTNYNVDDFFMYSAYPLMGD